MPHAIECRQLVKRYDGKPPVEAVRGLDLAVRGGRVLRPARARTARARPRRSRSSRGCSTPTAGEVEVLGLTLGPRRRRDPRADRHLAAGDAAGRQADRPRNGHAVPQLLSRRASTPDEAIAPRVAGGEGRRLRRQALRRAEAAAGRGLCPGRRSASCCSSTSRRPASIRSRGGSCGTSSATSASTGRTVLLTTHYMDEAERLCDRVAIVDHGKVIALGTPRGADRPARRRARHRVHARPTASPALDDGRAAPACRRCARCARGRRAYQPGGRASRTWRCRRCSTHLQQRGRDAGQPDDAARDAGRRVRHADRPAPARGGAARWPSRTQRTGRCGS